MILEGNPDLDFSEGDNNENFLCAIRLTLVNDKIDHFYFLLAQHKNREFSGNIQRSMAVYLKEYIQFHPSYRTPDREIKAGEIYYYIAQRGHRLALPTRQGLVELSDLLDIPPAPQNP
jgi:hypothetical protein